MKYKHLLSKGQIGTMSLKNRLVLPPLEVGMANFDGTPSEQLISYYLERAKNDVGLICTGITRVNEIHGATLPRQLSMSSDQHIPPFSRMVEKIHQYDTKIVCQLHHPGRQSLSLMIGFWPWIQAIGRLWPGFWHFFPKFVPSGTWMVDNIWGPSVVAPSPIPCTQCKQRTRGLTVSEIKSLTKDFINAAVRVKASGADGVQLHAAHGYLIQQFLSPRTNKRNDEYGGSLENRMKFLLDMIKGIKQVCGANFPVLVRLAVDEYYWAIGEKDQGIVLAEGIQMAKAIENAGADAIDVTSGTYETMNYWLEPTSFEPGWRKNLASTIKSNVNIPVIAANLIRSPQQAEKQLQEGTQDFAALGRQLLADPQWLTKARDGREHDIIRCICCLYCIESLNENAALGEPLGCSVNPSLGREAFMNQLPGNGNGRIVVIIGAGPAGLMASTILGQRQFKPIVFEQNDCVGGQLQLANKPPKKEKINWCFQDMYTQAKKAGAEFRFQTKPSVSDIKKINPYAILVATGGIPIIPEIKGIDLPHVIPFVDVLSGAMDIKNKTVAIIGSGMSGLETAEKLAENGNQLKIIEMLDQIAPGVYHQNTTDVMSRLNACNPDCVTGHKLIEICNNHIVLQNTHTQKNVIYDVDTVVIAVGMKPNNAMYTELKEHFDKVFLMGDARKVGRIATATSDGFNVATAPPLN
ncbi:MAG: NADH:flavin oxidoreductase/NADH oxidase [Candidatus Magnetoglobus multicellularis str. Araruama]|uniref:NADH:flavin oxidoreductase/NADH oxidase n=1 Tax=Candidatus Magnetoglobus multicellularis str. Araruama TaxID=890399 RepID=A0A1V1PDN7_9BACT|nr:MAG: NADH:flavin oxidoreductase/NADH oxidase [Candidatus Magnetoglobus multicellularis str. Araruama]